MAERDGLKARLSGRPGHLIRPANDSLSRSAFGVQVGDHHRCPEAGETVSDPCDRLGQIEAPAAVDVAVDCEQDGRFDLAEAVDHAAYAELRGAAGPHGADRGAGQQPYHRLGDVRHQRGHTISPSHAQPPQTCGRARHRLGELSIGERYGRTGLGVGDQGGMPVAPCQGVLCVVEEGALEPAGTLDRPLCEHPFVGPVGPYAEVFPDRCPERLNIVHRPAPQGLVVREDQTPGLAQPAHVAGHVRML